MQATCRQWLRQPKLRRIAEPFGALLPVQNVFGLLLADIRAIGVEAGGRSADRGGQLVNRGLQRRRCPGVRTVTPSSTIGLTRDGTFSIDLLHVLSVDAAA